MGVCYRLPEQDKEVDEAIYRQLEATSKALVPWFLWGTLTALTFAGEEIQRRTNSPGGPWKALMTIFDKVVEYLTRSGVIPDFILTKREGLVGDVRLAAASAAVTKSL